MNQTALSIVLGLLAGAAGALAVQYIGVGKDGTRASSAGDLSADSGIEARLERIEALLERRGPMTASPGGSEPSLRGSGGEGSAGVLAGTDLDVLVARLEERLKPIVQESVTSSMKEAMDDGGGGTRVKISKPKGKKRVTLAEAAAELGLTREEEDAVRRIAGETTDEFFKLLAGKEGTAEDVRREFEDARDDPQKKIELTTKYMGKAMSNLGGLITLGMNHDRKMKEAVGPEKARKIDRQYKITDLDPLGLEDMFQFD